MNAQRFDLGIGEATVPLGGHIGYWYRTVEEKTEALLDYFFAGIRSGQFCIYVCPDEERDGFLAAGARRLGEPLSDVRLQVVSAEEFYYRGGRFRANRLLVALPDAVRQAQAAGFTTLRAAGELPRRVRSRVAMDDFMEYEEKVTRDFFSRFPAIGLCPFPMDAFGAEWMMGLFRTHPLMLSKGGFFENPAYRRA